MPSYLISLIIGAAIGTAIYAIFSLFSEARDDGKEYRDRPPRALRIVWPLILVAAQSTSWMISIDRAERIRGRLRRAGQEYSLTTSQFFGSKVVSAVGGALLALVLGSVVQIGAIACVVVGALLGFFYPDVWLNDRTKRRNLHILKALPFFLDIVTLAVEAGLNLSGAIQQSVEKSKSSPLTYEMNRVLRDVRAGRPRVEALRELADRLQFAPISSMVSAIVQGELMGSSLGPILRAQSDQRRAERFQRAEKLAMEAPVKLLGPLIMFIFPCTFIVLGFPIVMKFLSSGL